MRRSWRRGAGCGGFADAVRAAQAALGFSTARRTAWLLRHGEVGAHAGPTSRDWALRRATRSPLPRAGGIRSGRAAWRSPTRRSRELGRHSDSLAAWLAAAGGAAARPRQVGAGIAHRAEWRRGLVDRLSRFTRDASFDMLCLGPGEEKLAAALI